MKERKNGLLRNYPYTWTKAKHPTQTSNFDENRKSKIEKKVQFQTPEISKKKMKTLSMRLPPTFFSGR